MALTCYIQYLCLCTYSYHVYSTCMYRFMCVHKHFRKIFALCTSLYTYNEKNIPKYYLGKASASIQFFPKWCSNKDIPTKWAFGIYTNLFPYICIYIYAYKHIYIHRCAVACRYTKCKFVWLCVHKCMATSLSILLHVMLRASTKVFKGYSSQPTHTLRLLSYCIGSSKTAALGAWRLDDCSIGWLRLLACLPVWLTQHHTGQLSIRLPELSCSPCFWVLWDEYCSLLLLHTKGILAKFRYTHTYIHMYMYIWITIWWLRSQASNNEPIAFLVCYAFALATDFAASYLFHLFLVILFKTSSYTYCKAQYLLAEIANECKFCTDVNITISKWRICLNI